MNTLDRILQRLAGKRERIIDLQRRLTAVPALGPANDGPGEWAKTRVLLDILAESGLSVSREMHAPDARVAEGTRPNVAVVIPGVDTSRTLWIIGHTDIVPPGDPGLWSGDPYVLRVDGDRVYGRGVEDNQQAIVCGLILAEALREEGVVPPLNLGLLFVADEETGSKFGLGYVVDAHRDIFGNRDLILVPDFGQPDGSLMEVAEKSMLWLKVTVQGRQCHASTPTEGRNSLVAAADFILRVHSLYQKFPQTDPMFDPPISTFEPTKKEANVENINTVPGKDVFYIDCRVLPQVPLAEVLAAIKALGSEVEQAHEVRIEYHEVQREDAAPPTSADSEVVVRLTRAIESVHGHRPKPAGIGGGTVAAFLRRAGLPAVVWSTLEHNAHQPDERSSIAFTIQDAQVFARVLFDDQ